MRRLWLRVPCRKIPVCRYSLTKGKKWPRAQLTKSAVPFLLPDKLPTFHFRISLLLSLRSLPRMNFFDLIAKLLS